MRRALHSRFPRIATFAARRIRLRNAPGSAYADPSAHISGIVHSCPHLGYLNYICNAYHDVVGTEYIGFAHVPRLRRRCWRRRRRRRCRCRCRRLRRGGTTYAYVYSSAKRPFIYIHALPVNTRGRTHTRFHVCTQSYARSRVDAPSASVHRCYRIRVRRVCTGLHTRMRTRTRMRACHNTLCPVIALHTSVISASLSLPLCKSRCATVTYIRDSWRVRMS